MSRYIAKYMNLEKSKRPTFWNGGSIYIYVVLDMTRISKIHLTTDWYYSKCKEHV